MSLSAGDVSIAFYPASTINTASSRLRCYGLARECARLGYQVSELDAANPPHVLFVQKIVNEHVLAVAAATKERGGHVFYDIDDYGENALGNLKGDDSTFQKFIELVSAVVVDTTVRREVFLKEPGFGTVGEIWVVPDPIDYIDTEIPNQTKVFTNTGAKLRACWFGNGPNIAPAIPYLSGLVIIGAVADVTVFTNAQFMDFFREKLPLFNSVPWALETFPAMVSAMDFCVLIHDTGLEGVQKSNNKMLASLALGVVPFVSRTPAYAETAEEMGIPELVIDNPQDLVNRIRPESFYAIAAKVQSEQCRRYLEKYYPAETAKVFSDKLLAHLNARA